MNSPLEARAYLTCATKPASRMAPAECQAQRDKHQPLAVLPAALDRQVVRQANRQAAKQVARQPAAARGAPMVAGATAIRQECQAVVAADH